MDKKIKYGLICLALLIGVQIMAPKAHAALITTCITVGTIQSCITTDSEVRR